VRHLIDRVDAKLSELVPTPAHDSSVDADHTRRGFSCGDATDRTADVYLGRRGHDIRAAVPDLTDIVRPPTFDRAVVKENARVQVASGDVQGLSSTSNINGDWVSYAFKENSPLSKLSIAVASPAFD
jgi:hypothetical protein